MINGLTYLPDFINQSKHDWLIEQIDSAVWLNDLKRRVQHYGYKYNYTSKRIDRSMRIGELPPWINDIDLPFIPDQVIVNEYTPGQGINNHIDCKPCFADTIASLSLGSACVMNLTKKQVIPILLEPRSLLILQDEARWEWMHGIPARKIDQYEGKTIHRSRRISLTFRKVILEK